MRNIFEFATKELSQDAFLSWFIANCNEPGISEHSYKFINLITGFNFRCGEIKKVQIIQQEHNMDIIVDFWTSDNLDQSPDYVIVIEDKTTSSAHSSQLRKYADELSKWNKKEPDYVSRRRKVFYKAGYLTDQDKEEIIKGDDGYAENDRWRVFNIDDIYKFFSKMPPVESEVLSSYKEHILKIYDDLHIVSKKPMKEWDYINYQTYFKKVINEKFQFPKDKYHFETWQYQGRLVSVAFYYHPQNPKFDKGVSEKYKCFAYPLVEFVIRKYSKEITIYSHITYHWVDKDGEHWSWKNTSYKPDPQEARSLMEDVRSGLKESIPTAKTHKMGSDSAQTISSDSIDISDSLEGTEKKILEKLNAYFKVFEKVDKQ